MRTTILKGATRTLAPHAARALFPRKSAVDRATAWASRSVFPGRRRSSTAMTAAKGFGAAAIAIPVGMWLGRRMKREA